jgi:hypothetical protein
MPHEEGSLGSLFYGLSPAPYKNNKQKHWLRRQHRHVSPTRDISARSSLHDLGKIAVISSQDIDLKKE